MNILVSFLPVMKKIYIFSLQEFIKIRVFQTIFVLLRAIILSFTNLSIFSIRTCDPCTSRVIKFIFSENSEILLCYTWLHQPLNMITHTLPNIHGIHHLLFLWAHIDGQLFPISPLYLFPPIIVRINRAYLKYLIVLWSLMICFIPLIIAFIR